ncbi:MAG: TIM barrel protein [Lachnospiraceae bacterium]|nr:TIM barrel protein [Lachnospiraceae bacterium]
MKDAGYDYFEIAIDGTPEKLQRLTNREEMRTIRAMSERYDMPLYTFAFTANRFYPLGEPDCQIRAKGVELLNQACDFAAYVGAQTINIAAYDVYQKESTPETEALFIDSLERCADHAATRGVIISLETMDSHFIDTTKKALKYVNMIGSPYVQIGADPGNITAMGHNPITDIPVGGRHIVEVEFKDTLLGDVRDIDLGKGIVDFDGVFKMLGEIGYRGFLAFETWAHEDPANHYKIFDAIEFLKGKMADY